MVTSGMAQPFLRYVIALELLNQTSASAQFVRD
jgi:hypothetical protein